METWALKTQKTHTRTSTCTTLTNMCKHTTLRPHLFSWWHAFLLLKCTSHTPSRARTYCTPHQHLAHKHTHQLKMNYESISLTLLPCASHYIDLLNPPSPQIHNSLISHLFCITSFWHPLFIPLLYSSSASYSSTSDSPPPTYCMSELGSIHAVCLWIPKLHFEVLHLSVSQTGACASGLSVCVRLGPGHITVMLKWC